MSTTATILGSQGYLLYTGLTAFKNISQGAMVPQKETLWQVL